MGRWSIPKVRRLRAACGQLEQRVNGEMALARERLEELYGKTLERMASELRNGLLTSTRRIKALEEAIGPDEAPRQ